MLKESAELLSLIKLNIEKVIVGKSRAIELVLASLLAGGHTLIEDVPGLGKTTMVSALARTLDLSFRRIQFTPDVLPSDVTGFVKYNLHSGEKEVVQGAVMSSIVLADEINRTSPKTQSALLEAMQEGQVTIDGASYRLPDPFMVLATQNPVELIGTYPLPEAQLDRFLMRISMGYPSHGDEMEILSRGRDGSHPDTLSPVCGAAEVQSLQKECAGITCAAPVLDYIVAIAEKTRASDDVSLGVSPRGSLSLMRAGMAWAMLQNRDFVLPDDIQQMAQYVLAHRMVVTAQAGMSGVTPESVISGILKTLRVPAVS